MPSSDDAAGCRSCCCRLFMASFLGQRHLFESHTAGLIWELGCFLIALMGIALRVFTTGTSPRGHLRP